MQSIVSLIVLCEHNGLQTGPFGSQLKAEEYCSTGIPVIMPKDIVSGRICLDSVARIAQEKVSALLRHSLKSGDIIFGRRGDLTKIAIVTDKEDGFICGTGCLRARVKKGVSPFYLFQVLGLRHISIWLAQNAVGQTMPNLNTEILGQLPIPILPYEEQCKVSRTLARWDQFISLNEQLIAAKQDRRKWLMQQYLTGKSRLPGFKKRWHIVSLGSVFTNRVETNFVDLPLVAITGENGVVPREEFARRDNSSEDKSRYLRICPGDIGCNTMRMWQGVCGFSKLEGIVSPAYTVVTPRTTWTANSWPCCSSPSRSFIFFTGTRKAWSMIP